MLTCGNMSMMYNKLGDHNERRKSNARAMVDKVIHWSTVNRVKLNSEKCKELRISFSKDQPVFDLIILNGQPLEVVKSVKLLGVKLKNNLLWNEHINDTIKKASKRLFSRSIEKSKCFIERLGSLLYNVYQICPDLCRPGVL